MALFNLWYITINCYIRDVITLKINNNEEYYESSLIIENKKETRAKIPIKITEKSYLTCIGKTMSVANVLNNEYQQIAKEDDENEEFNYLEGFLETEISSIKGLEKVEKKKLENQNEETRFFSNSTRRGKY